MIPLFAATIALALAATGTALAEKLTIALSSPDVTINSSFAGANLTVFGVIDRGGTATASTPGYEIAVVLQGPPETVVARRKERILGIWANAASERFEAAPSFYAVSTSTEIGALANPPVLGRLQLGIDAITFHYAGRAAANDPPAAGFRDAFVRLKQRTRLYQQQVDVRFVGDVIFRTTFRLPASIPIGPYRADAYLFSAGQLVARADESLIVTKTGAEDTLSAFARNQSLLYGLICVALALVTGWLGGVIFRRD